jgi:hypothetical protein
MPISGGQTNLDLQTIDGEHETRKERKTNKEITVRSYSNRQVMLFKADF